MPYRAMPYGATPCHTLLAYEDPPPHGKSVCTYLWILNRLLQWSWVFSEFIFLMQKQRGTLASIEWSNLNLLPCLHVNNPTFSAYIAVCCFYIYTFICLWSCCCDKIVHIFSWILNLLSFTSTIPYFLRKAIYRENIKSPAFLHIHRCRAKMNPTMMMLMMMMMMVMMVMMVIIVE